MMLIKIGDWYVRPDAVRAIEPADWGAEHPSGSIVYVDGVDGGSERSGIPVLDEAAGQIQRRVNRAVSQLHGGIMLVDDGRDYRTWPMRICDWLGV